MQKTIAELASIVQGTVLGNASVRIKGITNIENLEPGCIAFIQDKKDLAAAESSELACIIVPKSITQSSKNLLQVANPKLAWALLLREFYPARLFSKEISRQASISPKAKLGKHVTVEPFAVIQEGVEVGDYSVIRSHVYLDHGVKVGSHSVIHPGVMVYENTQIGSKVTIHAGCVLGADGFGYVHTEKGQAKVPQVGNVVLEDEVELGACVTIDRATVGSTVIGYGCKIDNLVQIGHNVIIKEHTVISAQTGISGSCKIGAHVTMGGKAGLGDHVEIGDWTMVGAGAGLPTGKKIPAKQIIFGQPARPYQEARRQIGAQLRSAEMLDDIRKLKREVAELKEKLQIPSSRITAD